MTATDLRLYCSKYHLLPLFIETDIEWSSNDPTDLDPFDNIKQSVQQRRHSDPALNEENLMTLEYFAALEQGTNKIKSLTENGELTLSPM